MNNEAMFEYFMQMSAMQPEQQQMMRRQAMVDALRQRAMEDKKGQMVGGYYVAPSIVSPIIDQLTARRDQKMIDEQMQGMQNRERKIIEEMRNRRMMGRAGNMSMQNQQMPTMQDMYMNLPRYGNEA
jgi:hypothetical protein